MIRFLDLPSQYRTLKLEIDSAIESIISSGAFIGGGAVAAFEAEFGKYQDVGHCIGVANGTDALEIAIEALSLPPNSEIIVPANSFVASSEAVTRSGHKVVFADVDPNTYLLDYEDVERRVSLATAAIMAVHLYGQPAPMFELSAVAARHGLRIIEDCAQAHGAEIDGKRVGGLGDIGTFSFYPGKNLGAYGDGGAIVCDDIDLARKCRMIANHGRVEKYDHEFEGRNSRLDALQAAVLSVKLKKLDRWIERRNELASVYAEALSRVDGILVPQVTDNLRHSWHLYVVRAEQRSALKEYLAANEVQTGIHYPIALPRLKAYAEHAQSKEAMVACNQDSKLLSLPIGEHMDCDDALHVSAIIERFFASR